MAYNLGDRFPPPPKSFTLLDPGAYQYNVQSKYKLSKAPFLSKVPRKTQAGAQLWTHAIYYADFPPKIPNCASMMSKRPRFPYEALSKEDLEDILCRCGVQNVCECASEEIEPAFICQGKVPRRLFKGHPPRSSMGEGLSSPSKRDHGFKVNTDGSQKRITSKVSDESPPFYDIRVDESSAFYQGCKWSQRTSKRSSKEQEHSPGPAAYTLERERTQAEVCDEAVRAYKRKRSKQLRFIEMMQQRNILEGFPGPASYSPNLPAGAGSNMQFLGPKADRFPVTTEQRPGPADHWIHRDFDLPIPPWEPCHAKLPEPSFFGVKANRFKSRKEEGASSATYNPGGKECLIKHCSTAPFGSSTVRFKQEPIKEEEDCVKMVSEEEPMKRDSVKDINVCQMPTWEFRSKTIRMKPLEKKWNEQSPADWPQQNYKVNRLRQFQYTAPFFSSEGRFQPWNDWMPVFGKYETPGPCYYNLEKPKCYPAVCRGPLVRACRFPSATFDTPAPNEYQVGGGVETVLATHNQKLKVNMENQHKFIWEAPVESKTLSFNEQETALLNKSIALLDGDIFDQNATTVADQKLEIVNDQLKPKLLRYFLYNHPTPSCV